MPLLRTQIEEGNATIANLRRQNESLFTLQSQINDFVTQMREKQNLEILNAQLRRDLENLRISSANEA